MRTISFPTVLLLLIALPVPDLACAGEAEWKVYMDAGVAVFQRGDNHAAAIRLEAPLKDAQAFGSDNARVGVMQSWLGDV